MASTRLINPNKKIPNNHLIFFEMNDINLLIIIVAVVFFFFVLRELFTWYWKINKLVEGQEKTNQLLQQLINYHLYGKSESPEQEEEQGKKNAWKMDVKWKIKSLFGLPGR